MCMSLFDYAQSDILILPSKSHLCGGAFHILEIAGKKRSVA